MPVELVGEAERVVAIVQAFITAMNNWEVLSAAREEREGHLVTFMDDVERDMQKIFKVFCTTRERKYGRNGTFSTPPEYNPKTEAFVLVSVDADKARVRMLRKNRVREVEREYFLFKRGDAWLIDNVLQKHLPGDWERGIL